MWTKPFWNRNKAKDKTLQVFLIGIPCTGFLSRVAAARVFPSSYVYLVVSYPTGKSLSCAMNRKLSQHVTMHFPPCFVHIFALFTLYALFVQFLVRQRNLWTRLFNTFFKLFENSFVLVEKDVHGCSMWIIVLGLEGKKLLKILLKFHCNIAAPSS